MSNDLIRRSDAINLCEIWRDRAKAVKDKEGWWMADNLLKLMKDTPTVEPKRGEWDGTVCSECGNDFMDDFYYTEDGGFFKHPNFCPNCGAKMKVVKR